MAGQASGAAGFFLQAGSIVSAAYTAAMKGGELQAAFRQGANEMGVALKAFPDAIQVDEPGAVFNPLYSDISADKRAAAGHEAPAKGRLTTPGEIARGHDSGSVHGTHQHGAKAPLPSPSDIAKHAPEQSKTDRGQEHGRGM